MISCGQSLSHVVFVSCGQSVVIILCFVSMYINLNTMQWPHWNWLRRNFVHSNDDDDCEYEEPMHTTNKGKSHRPSSTQLEELKHLVQERERVSTQQLSFIKKPDLTVFLKSNKFDFRVTVTEKVIWSHCAWFSEFHLPIESLNVNIAALCFRFHKYHSNQ